MLVAMYTGPHQEKDIILPNKEILTFKHKEPREVDRKWKDLLDAHPEIETYDTEELDKNMLM